MEGTSNEFSYDKFLRIDFTFSISGLSDSAIIDADLNPDMFPELTEVDFYQRYGDPFHESLAAFDRLSSPQQMFLIYQVQR